MKQLYNEGDVLIPTRDMWDKWQAGEVITIKQVMEGRIVAETKTAGLIGFYPIELILTCPIPKIEDDGEPILCPICWGRKGNLVHADCVDENGRRFSRNYIKNCEVCDGKGEMPVADALAWIDKELGRRQAKREELAQRMKK